MNLSFDKDPSVTSQELLQEILQEVLDILEP